MSWFEHNWKLACPTCGYDLRGTPPEDPARDDVRCPECGAMTHTAAILSEQHRLAREARNRFALLVGAVVLVFVVTVLWPALSSLAAALSGSMAPAFLLLLGFFYVMSFAFFESPQHFRVLFSIGATVAVLVGLALLPKATGFPFALIWIAGCAYYARRRGYT